ncbi:TetR/AcrR family transcriptional regulator [Tundrisphaera lichenicola]|uniref:TetR/AcrR family transcriptional regulator n=1 Tax=Tundrisphaera lichenicola TaxID=2029860 RepID=UPI003EC0D8FB
MTDSITSKTVAPLQSTRESRVSPEEILDAATDLFAEFGFSDAVTNDLMEKLGIGKGTIYRHYPSKRDLFLAAVDRVMKRLRDCIDDSIASVQDPIDRIEAATRSFLGFFATHPKYVELLIQERAIFRDRTTPTYFEHRERNKLRWHEVYQSLIKEGRIREMPVERISTVFLDLAYGTIFTNHFSGRAASPDEQARDILDIIFHGILGESERLGNDPRPRKVSAAARLDEQSSTNPEIGNSGPRIRRADRSGQDV